MYYVYLSSQTTVSSSTRALFSDSAVNQFLAHPFYFFGTISRCSEINSGNRKKNIYIKGWFDRNTKKQK